MYLGIDTATSRGSLALARPGELIAESPLVEGSQHARDLMARLDRLLGDRGLKATDLRGVGVAIGPGSFTGVRIGLATAKGIAYALQIGALGVSTLEATAVAALRAGDWSEGAIGVALEAGRGEIYWALFTVQDGALSRARDDRVCPPSRAAEELPERLLLAGSAGPRLAELAERRGGVRCQLLETPPPLAGSIALLAAAALPAGSVYRPGDLRPNYIRSADAEAPRRRL